jgi:hypothetical protein
MRDINNVWAVLAFALVMTTVPFIPGIPPFWIVLLDNIGLAALGCDGPGTADRRGWSYIVRSSRVLRFRRLCDRGI